MMNRTLPLGLQKGYHLEVIDNAWIADTLSDDEIVPLQVEETFKKESEDEADRSVDKRKRRAWSDLALDELARQASLSV
uniref:AlNc14C38G3317 protein n=1 Tax=Albugo laibachii Nc14 TaxID=890382 RepID=F0W951_9STRA|nr:AlNc14C38G3317 [Albugo laibachii Nc14]|eukprot:CCA17663.1 AlNc14C38G3317 [Albugo laibachii Nc14]